MKRNSTLTAFYLETLVLILVMTAIILVLTGVFGLGRTQSAAARELTDAVCLAQNAAEAFSASESEEELLALLDEGGNAQKMPDTAGVIARYDAAMRPDPGGTYRVDVTWLAGEDGLARGTIQVRCGGREEPVYELNTAVFHREAAE